MCWPARLCAPSRKARSEPPASAAPVAHSSIPAADARVDINTAGLDQLIKVPELPRTWAARIIRNRTYRAKNELVDRGAVTPRVYDQDHIIAHREKQ